MSGSRRKLATKSTKPYDFVKRDDLERRLGEYDQEVAKAFRERFGAHDEKIREDLDDIFADQDARTAASLRQFERRLRDRFMVLVYVLAGGAAAALAVAIVALVLAATG